MVYSKNLSRGNQFLIGIHDLGEPRSIIVWNDYRFKDQSPPLFHVMDLGRTY